MTEQQIKCEQCGSDYPLSSNLHSHAIAEGVKEFTIVCPICQMSTHVNYETPEIVNARTKLKSMLERYSACAEKEKQRRWDQYKTTRDAFMRIYNSEQDRWKRKRPVSV